MIYLFHSSIALLSQLSVLWRAFYEIKQNMFLNLKKALFYSPGSFFVTEDDFANLTCFGHVSCSSYNVRIMCVVRQIIFINEINYLGMSQQYWRENFLMNFSTSILIQFQFGMAGKFSLLCNARFGNDSLAWSILLLRRLDLGEDLVMTIQMFISLGQC